MDVLSTAVSETLTARPDATETPVKTDTPASTLLPTSTVQEMTATVSPTPTEMVGDPIHQFGQPTGKDTLDSGKGFGIGPGGYEDDNIKIYVSGGALVFSSFSTGGWHSWRVRPPEMSDFYIDATLTVDNCNGKDQYGLILRTPSYESGNGYYYGLTCDGKLSLTKVSDEGRVPLLSNLESDKVHPGAGQTNRLGILARGSSLKLYVNGFEIQEVSDDTFKRGFFGIFVSGFSGNGFTVKLDEISYWNHP